jgi:hypothetical protein
MVNGWDFGGLTPLDELLNDEKKQYLSALSGSNLLYQMESHGWRKVLSGKVRWKGRGFSSRSVFIRGAMPQEGDLARVEAELVSRPLKMLNILSTARKNYPKEMHLVSQGNE